MANDAKLSEENRKLWAAIEELKREVQELKRRQQAVSKMLEERQQRQFEH
jgi:prefoldin subunit 5